jgi:hypothetical protein
MNTSTALRNVSVTHHFMHQMEKFCRGERLSLADARSISSAVVERVCGAHGSDVIFAPEGRKLPVAARLTSGEQVKVLVVFDETAQGFRTILKIASARILRKVPVEDKPEGDKS